MYRARIVAESSRPMRLCYHGLDTSDPDYQTLGLELGQ